MTPTPFWRGEFPTFEEAALFQRNALHEALAQGHAIRVAHIDMLEDFESEAVIWRALVRVFPARQDKQQEKAA